MIDYKKGIATVKCCDTLFCVLERIDNLVCANIVCSTVERTNNDKKQDLRFESSLKGEWDSAPRATRP